MRAVACVAFGIFCGFGAAAVILPSVSVAEPSTDAALRDRALYLAASFSGQDRSPAAIQARAEMMLAFLKGGSSQRATLWREVE